MSKDVVELMDRIVDASMAPASRAMVPLLREVRTAIELSGGYDEADAALRRLEGKARASGLEDVLVGAMMNGTSAGAVG